METVNEYIKSLDVSDKVKAILIAEYSDLSIEDLKDLTISEDINIVTIDDNSWMILDDEIEVIDYIQDQIDEIIYELQSETDHNYDWLISYLDSKEIATMSDIYDFQPDAKEIDYNDSYFYYWEW